MNDVRASRYTCEQQRECYEHFAPNGAKHCECRQLSAV